MKKIYKYNLPENQARIIDETNFLFSPPELNNSVDLACFVPMPDSHQPVILLNPGIIKNFSKDKMFRMKISLIFAHEVVGHALQHRLQVIDNTDGMFLDYELMEGCGIVAESSLRLFGDFGKAAATLYKVKRILTFAFTMLENPLIYQKIISFKEIWPDFFCSDDFNIFRRSTRRHSEGILKTYLEFNNSSSTCEITPWKTITR
ncbi:hypothetical protein [Rothia sp. ZJ1223]|uniref:hypothetical protein n=1 Tax=Rothia sp. ZJ1223 TaxID=2811098 RepID=UPI00195E44F4|nr:hypothetical protein [Rothia sp. ZJ1223]MBM7051626.1 hypothetical protein [Rothia sp. ZJ1223]